MRSSELAGARVLLLGTGREMTPFARAILGVAAHVEAIDGREGASAEAWRQEWGDRIPLTVAERSAELASRFDLAVTSPGIPPSNPLRADLVAAGVPVTMPTDIWLSDHAERTTGVTGSKGKSTTTSLVAALLRAHGVDVALGGNIGIGVWSLPEAERYAVELSSYQSSTVSRSPDVAVLTSLFPEHLDWHGGADNYYADKLNLLRHDPRQAIVNGRDPVVAEALARHLPDLDVERVGAAGSRWTLDEDGAIRRDGELLVSAGTGRLRGGHNVLNVALALAATEASGVDLDRETVARALGDFAPLEHRLDEFAQHAGTLFVDDVLSTAPQGVVRALEAYAGRPIALLVGGQDRGVDYAPLAERLREVPVTALVGLPGDGRDVLALVAPAGTPAEQATDMEDAVRRARALLPDGGVVLLSPGAPSYGRYADYRERAADFRQAVERSIASS